MQCPACGYDGIADDAFFCPNCRHKFREPENDVYFNRPENGAAKPVDYYSADEALFSEKEIRRIEVQLLQPAVLVTLGSAAAVYLSVGQVSRFSLTFAGMEVQAGGLISFLAGILAGWIFYRIALYRIEW